MELALVPDSSLIGAQGYDAEEFLLYICFKEKGEVKPEVYEYQNVAPELYGEMVGHRSMGGFFSANIKPFKQRYPFRRLAPEEARDLFSNGHAAETTATDFTNNGTPVPAEIVIIPEDAEQLKAQAVELSEKTKAIAITSPEAYQLAATTLLAIARMRASLETTFRPDIQEKHRIWKAALAVLGHYDDPLAADEKRLKEGMSSFKRREDEARHAAEKAERDRLQAEAEAEAKRRAQELQLADAIAAESRGEKELAKSIIESAPLPMAPVYSPPVSYPSNVPRTTGITHVENWDFEIIDELQVPRKYLLIDERALRNEARTLKSRASVPGVRFFDRGSVRTSRR